MTSTHEQWDIVSSVGLTALGVASGRAIETARGGLINDPYAAAFVRAVKPVTSLPTSIDEIAEGEPEQVWDRMAGYLGVRSRFFDEYFAAVGIAQVVILAAGLDARAFRLDWPSGCDLYEVDQPKVLEFKQQVLDEIGARPACRRHAVATDLRDDWVATLTEAGFAPGRPTLWLAEGLLLYLPARAEEALFNEVHQLSAPGSSIALDRAPTHNADFMRNQPTPTFPGLPEFDFTKLISTEPRRNCVDWLRSVGWDVTVESAAEVSARYDHPVHPDFADMMKLGTLVTARRAG
ncbi:SAM-dependent methyltransferase [Streptomyces halobius]|uniref:S-adenosyl-L-methionine-dependent methyltransferase n=1 Tax=Streptomyces halobius TaxID=2879846 RepID=A0ABY4LYE3_9ACTN|nr:SAM-dependent methyltransferase [Streptomyces halobius]UQA90530.1 SAM-dependent methyltransferase [Streptomyces halobius]